MGSSNIYGQEMTLHDTGRTIERLHAESKEATGEHQFDLISKRK
jgi:hypothetical protein